jgi:hypothetical protein
MEKIFLSVGAMKAGTTFLFEVLRQHPKICFTPEKELHYFAHIRGLDPRLSRPVMKPKTSARPYIRSISPANNLKGKILSHEFRRHRLASVMRGRFSRIDSADELRAKVLWYADRYLIDPIDDHWIRPCLRNPKMHTAQTSVTTTHYWVRPPGNTYNTAWQEKNCVFYML